MASVTMAPEGDSHRCAVCDEELTTALGLKDHLVSHMVATSTQCKECDKCFTTEERLQKHLMLHVGIRSFPCTVCPRGFDSSKSLRMHMAFHKQGKHQCRMCDAVFTLDDLNHHLLKHLGIKPFLCVVCNKRFNQPRELKKHLRSHNNEKPFACCECPKTFAREYYLKIHMESHSALKVQSCEICAKVFSTERTLKFHMKSHTTPYKCRVCDNVFTSEGELREHMAVHPNVTPYECDFCQRGFIVEQSLKRHLREKHAEHLDLDNEQLDNTNEQVMSDSGKDDPDKPVDMTIDHLNEDLDLKPLHTSTVLFEESPSLQVVGMSGSLCEGQIDDTSNDDIHNQNNDGPENEEETARSDKLGDQKRDLNYIYTASSDNKSEQIKETVESAADVSGKDCDVKSMLSDITSVATVYLETKPVDEPPYEDNAIPEDKPCEVCQKRFSNTSELQSHMKTHQEDLKSFQCDQCQKIFKTQYKLQQHLLTHVGDKPFKCSKCLKGFTKTSYLRDHMLQHVQIRPQRCTLCPKVFTNMLSLKRHMLKHANPHFCDLCQMEFSTGALLNRHMKIHTEFTSLTCDICNQNFTTASSVQDHMNAVHAGERKQFPCDVCDKVYFTAVNLKRHLEVHSQHRSYSCHLCPKVFATSLQLNKHISEQLCTRFECHVCKLIYEEEYKLKDHMADLHPGVPVYYCGECEKEFTSKSDFMDHNSEIHFEDDLLRCPVCSKKINGTLSFKEHMKIHNTENGQKEERPIGVATMVGTSQKRKISSASHELPFNNIQAQQDMAIVEYNVEDNESGPGNNNSDKITSVSFHGDSFTPAPLDDMSDSLTQTQIKVEPVDDTEEINLQIASQPIAPEPIQIKPEPTDVSTNAPTYISTILSKVVPEEPSSSLNKSAGGAPPTKKSKTNVGNSAHECPVCHKIFKGAYPLKKHMVIHTGELPYKCELCDRGFKRSDDLKFHRVFHSEGGPYTCDLCKKDFIKSSQRDEHVANRVCHKAECHVCKQIFAMEKDLKGHMATFHPEEPLFKCSVCKMGFLRKTTMEMHVSSVHTDSKQFQCDICGKYLTRAASLKNHKEMHTRNQSERYISVRQAFEEAKQRRREMSKESSTPLDVLFNRESLEPLVHIDVKPDNENSK